MIDAEQIIDSTIRTAPELQVRIRINERTIIEKAVLVTIEDKNSDSDQGLFEMSPIAIRLAAASEPTAGILAIRAVVEVARVGSKDWTTLRIVGRRNTCGLLKLTMANPNE